MPLICRFNYLNVVHSDYAFSINVDQLFIEHVSRQQHFTVTPQKRSQIKNVGIQAHAFFAELRYAPPRQEKLTPAIPHDESGDRRMIDLAEPDNYLLQSRDTLAYELAH